MRRFGWYRILELVGFAGRYQNKLIDLVMVWHPDRFSVILETKMGKN